jgi:hypothetical protein
MVKPEYLALRCCRVLAVDDIFVNDVEVTLRATLLSVSSCVDQ